MKGWKKISHRNSNRKRAGVTIQIPEKTELKLKNVTRDKKGHPILIKRLIYQKDRIIINTQ